MRSEVLVSILLASAAPASAQSAVSHPQTVIATTSGVQIVIAAPDIQSNQVKSDLGLCTLGAGGLGYYVTPLFQWPATDTKTIEREFYEYIVKIKLRNNGLAIGCKRFEEEQSARREFTRYTEGSPRFTLLDFVPATSPSKKTAAPEQVSGSNLKSGNEDGKPAGPTPAEIAAEKSRAVAERNRQAQAKYEAELAAQKAKVEEFERAKAEVERKKQEQRASADRVLAEHNAKLAAHAETVRQHEEALARHKAEVEGAKEKILVDFDKRQAEASTDTDANRCVSGAEIRHNSGFKGNTAATVSNGCDTKADIQICLKVDARWNCGLRLGVLPRNSYTHAAPGGTGEVQVDARVTGSSRLLITPN